MAQVAIIQLEAGGRILNSERRRLYGVAKRRACRALEDFGRKGILQKAGAAGKGTYYILARKGFTRGSKETKGTRPERFTVGRFGIWYNRCTFAHCLVMSHSPNRKKVCFGGSMGNQLLRCFIAIADSLEKNYEIDSITVLNETNYLKELFDLKFPTYLLPGQVSQTMKALACLSAGDILGIDHNAEEYVHKLFKYRERILNEGLVKLREAKNFARAKVCIHMRGTDKKVAPLRWYYNKAKDNLPADGTLGVCTEDGWLRLKLKIGLKCAGISHVNFTNQDAVRDWFTLLHADKVYCSSSSFPLSTLLFDPDKKIIVCSRKSTNYNYRIESGYVAEFPFIETAMKYCPNLRFED